MHVGIFEAVVVVVHILEEQRFGSFRSWFNRLWGFNGDGNFPLSIKLNQVRNVWGLLFGLILLALYGKEGEAVLLGFFAADALQHLLFSFLPWSRSRAGLSPGWITSFVYLGIVLWRIDIVLEHPLLALIGAFALIFTYIEAGIQVLRKS